METEAFKQAYKAQLIEAGVPQQRASQVAEDLSHKELQVISEIWSQWSTTWNRLQGAS